MKFKGLLFIIIFFWSCKDKYTPNLGYSTSGFLVVEGFINTGGDSTSIMITRSTSLDSSQIVYESGAKVEIQSENGFSYPLYEKSAGKYFLDQSPVDGSQRYRMHIVTSDSKEYMSDYSEAKISPPIDSVSWIAEPDWVNFYVTTHDNTGQSIYYEWSFVETWQYTSPYVSQLIYYPPPPDPPANFKFRVDGALYATCYLNAYSTNFLLSSSAKLSSDVIYQFPFDQISYYTSNRLSAKYSMLVKQTVLTKDAYEWKQKLKKNTEELGSIFDPQPSETGGNIHCITNPGEQVVGFIWCSTQTTKRIFIERSQLPNAAIPTGYEGCYVDTVKMQEPDLGVHFADGFSLPLSFYTYPTLEQVVLGGSKSCVDCREKGGTIVKPDFW